MFGHVSRLRDSLAFILETGRALVFQWYYDPPDSSIPLLSELTHISAAASVAKSWILQQVVQEYAVISVPCSTLRRLLRWRIRLEDRRLHDSAADWRAFP
jgi:hypothetical protein